MNHLLAATTLTLGLAGLAAAQGALELRPGAAPANAPAAVAAPDAPALAAPVDAPDADARQGATKPAPSSQALPEVSRQTNAGRPAQAPENTPEKLPGKAPEKAPAIAEAAPVRAAPARSAKATEPAPVAAHEQGGSSAPVVSPVTSGSNAVNPFTGKALSIEQAQRQLELLRVQSQMLEEQLKQVGLTEEMKTVPLRKAVEAATATTALRKEASTQQQIEQSAQAAARSEAEARAAARAAARASAKPAQASAPAPAAAPAPPVRLVSVLNVGGRRAAVVTVGDASMIVRQGESSPLGMVDIVDDSTARLGGQVYVVNAQTLSRAVLSDQAAPKPADAGGTGAAVHAPASNAGLPPVTPPSSAAPASLPPLQLPAGVRLLPR